ncbi:lectin C-type domain-containing protein [Zopfia rhizophila CBS 207.26]|uniref:Maintenance of telomere capping protein 6 n=1 Tax=Zopfia rhizophila CBS 207.26 TaxID=1314779 RepID=A0A6A6ER38_9PEZI|nr:lectin C-type domain-containing protein [Zopfia rhizophila CBS 207.26]
MSSGHVPDESAKLAPPWENAFRVQRDVALRVPINYVTVPAASLRAACFAHNQYESSAFQKCFSNLLASGFQKYLIDVYWDPGRSVWSLCPAEIPPSEPEAGSEGSAAINIVLPTSQITLSGPSEIAKDFESAATLPPSLLTENEILISPRQNSQTPSPVSDSSFSGPASIGPSSVSEYVMATIPTTGTESSPTIIKSPGDGREPLVQIGPYNCTSGMTLGFLTGIFQEFLDFTGTTTHAAVTYLILNIHVAASHSSPSSPAQKLSPGQLPGSEHKISDILVGNFSTRLYTPQELREERSNLNESWLDVRPENLPSASYYQASKNSNDELVTMDGWPSEAYMEFKEFNRLVASFGSIDPEMADYNTAEDANAIFAPETIRSIHNTTISSTGSITSGCLFSPDNPSISASTNSSWAISQAPALNLRPDLNTTVPIPSIANLTSCGLSPLLNTTLSNVTADVNPVPYLTFAHSTLWTWAPGEPLNVSSTNHNPTQNRCAAMYTYSYPGRWWTVDCNSRHHVACQDTRNPYIWSLSRDSVNYFSGDRACPRSTIFSVPHTALENAYLLSSIQTTRSPRDDPDEPVYININALNVPNCWVTGINNTCPYVPPNDTNKTRVVVVPTVAAVIVFVLAALTFFVKCAANRQEDKRGRRRRNVGGWDYEGVPS